MIIRYEYKSACCGHEYVEQRVEDTPMIFTNCLKCGNGNYELVTEVTVE